MKDRIDAPAPERTEVHASFVIERALTASIAAVWHALSDTAARDQWFGGAPEFEVADRMHDFRIGGRATEHGQWHNGPRSRFESHLHQHRPRSPDRVHLRHVGRRPPPVDIAHHDRRRAPGR